MKMTLFRGEGGAYAHCLAIGVVGVDEDFLAVLRQLERPHYLLSIGILFVVHLVDGRELLGGDDGRGELAALYFAFIGTLDGAADGDDAVQAWRLEL